MTDPNHAQGDPALAGAAPADDIQATLDHAKSHADLTRGLLDSLGSSSPERVIAKLVEALVQRQTVFNESVLRILASAADRRLERQKQDHEALETVQASLNRVQDSLVEMERQQGTDHRELRVQAARLDMLLREARRRLPEPFDEEQLRTFTRQLADRLETLYADFEQTFRGTREEIQRKQRPYLSEVADLEGQDLYPVVDIGCGRGEWLELLSAQGITAYGIDVSETFVEMGRQRGLDVRLGDALEHLEKVPDGSIGAITGFHIIEHLEFQTLLSLIDASLRALRPGGLALFETPNPTNLTVGASSFWLDPTHRAPLHPQLMRFLFESRGFVDVRIREMNPAPEYEQFEGLDLEGRRPEELLERVRSALFGPQDYAVVARRPAWEEEDESEES